jgi:subtilisin family serine protease
MLRSTTIIRAGLGAALLLPAGCAQAVAAQPGPGAVRGATAGHSRQALVLLERSSSRDAGSARASAGAVATRNSLRRVRADVPDVGLMTVAVPAGKSFKAFARELDRDPDVARVEPQLRRRLRYVPNDPALTDFDYGAIPGVPFQWYLIRQHLPEAWERARGSNVKVGIIDTGIDAGNPDLAPQISALIDQDPTTDSTQDEVGHGTHVAGLACAAADNGLGMAGAGFGCQLVIEKSDLSAGSLVASIVDATNRGVKVINMSYGGKRESLAERRALRYAISKDVVLVAAASDTPEVNQGHPASDLQPIGTGSKLGVGDGLVVTAADSADDRAFFAGLGSEISLAAYGFTGSAGPTGIFSTFPAATTKIETGVTRPPSSPCGDCRGNFRGDTRYGYLVGTSMAAPQVTGVAALVRSINPRLPASSVIRILKESASLGGWSNDLGWGIVDAGAAVQQAIDYSADTLPPSTNARGVRRRNSSALFRLRWSSRDAAPAGVRPSGVASYRVFAKHGGGYKLVDTTTSGSARFRGSPGARYSFYVQARDRAGNLEAPPAGADFVVRVRQHEGGSKGA